MRRRDSRDGVRAQLSPSHYHAGEFGGFGTTILHRGMARRGCTLVAGCSRPPGASYAPIYRRATIMQASSAALGLLSSIAAWLAGATLWWLVAGALLGGV